MEVDRKNNKKLKTLSIMTWYLPFSNFIRSILVKTPIGQNKTLYKMMEIQLVILLWSITP